MAYRLLARFDDQMFRATLGQGRTVIGSDPGCDICLPTATVSRQHAALTVNDDRVELEDLGSRNGTLLRSRRVRQASLGTGDIFVVGRAVLLLEEVAQADLEVGIGMGERPPEPSNDRATSRDNTEAFGPLDRFALDALPRLLEQIADGNDREHLAQHLGFALFSTLPTQAVEIVEVQGQERGVLYAAEHAEADEEAGTWSEAAAGNCHVRVRFDTEGPGRHYRPILEAGALLLVLAAHGRETSREVQLPGQGAAKRPQPASVSREMQSIYEQATRVARGDVGVLIYGESGTGKEVLARFIHSASPRASQPMVAINCASLPRDLLEAELFGVERGVATGVEARAGKFELADRGTLFLDEIGDMAPETQAKILRVLQEREVFRLGGTRAIPARARVIAATNRPIAKMLAEGTFRSDLYHRIATWEVELPPLRRRQEDIPNLAAHFLAQEAQRCGVQVRGISRAALDALRRYAWPGNIRQLRNEISRAVLFLEDGELLDTARLGPALRGEPTARPERSLAMVLEATERAEITAALEACGGDTAAAAQRLGVSRPTLYRHIKNLDLPLPGGGQRPASAKDAG